MAEIANSIKSSTYRPLKKKSSARLFFALRLLILVDSTRLDLPIRILPSLDYVVSGSTVNVKCLLKPFTTIASLFLQIGMKHTIFFVSFFDDTNLYSYTIQN